LERGPDFRELLKTMAAIVEPFFDFSIIDDLQIFILFLEFVPQILRDFLCQIARNGFHLELVHRQRATDNDDPFFPLEEKIVFRLNIWPFDQVRGCKQKALATDARHQHKRDRDPQDSSAYKMEKTHLKHSLKKKKDGRKKQLIADNSRFPETDQGQK